MESYKKGNCHGRLRTCNLFEVVFPLIGLTQEVVIDIAKDI